MAHTAVCRSGENWVGGMQRGCLGKMGFDFPHLALPEGFRMSFSDVYLRYSGKGIETQPSQNTIDSKAWTLS